jgi:O-antigen/teichoic acid export membrane protein
LTVWLIGSGYGLVALALITIAATLLRGAIKIGLSFWQEPGLRLGFGHVQKSAARTLLGYSVWRMLMAASNIGITRINPLVIGYWLGVMLVTPYALAARLMAFVVQAMAAVRKVLTPAATEMHAQEKPEWQLAFMIKGGKYAAALSLFFLGGFCFLGEPFFELWIGPKMRGAGWLLFLLMLGEVLPLYQSGTTSMLLGMARHRVLAWLGIIEIVLGLGLAAVLISPYGLIGVCVAQAVSACLCRGILQLIFACRVVGLAVLPYLWRSFVPAVLAAALPAGLLGILVAFRQPKNWFELMGYGLIYAACYLVSCLFLTGVEPVRARVSGLFVRRVSSQKTVQDSLVLPENILT